MSNEPVDFATIELEDFDNLDFRRTYLAHHGASMEPEWDPNGHYTFCWPHGFMMAIPMDWKEDLANLWGCLFIFLWKYKKVKCYDASSLCSSYVANERRWLKQRKTW